MSSYLKKTQRGKGERGGDVSKTYYLEAMSGLKSVIEDIESLGDDSTLATLREYQDNGETQIPIEEVNAMLRQK